MPTPPYVIRDPVRGSYHFLRFTPLTQRWEPDLTIPGQIRNARTRLYHLVNPPPYYAEYQYATVDDDATLTLMYELRDPSVAQNFSDIRMAGAGLHRDYVRDAADPPTEDRTFRERRVTTLGSVTPPPAEEEEEYALTPLQRAMRLLLATGGEAGRPAPLAIPAAHWWDNDPWHTPVPRPPRTTALSALAALLRRSGDDAQAGGGAGAGAAWDTWYGGGEPQTQASVAIDPPRRNIADAMIRDAISQKATCPISMEPITQETAVCVAPCYHVFQRESIAQWLERETSCPTCREPCRL